ncbi:MAG: HEAT repeat domain-containing protein [Planctomycetota bacterium]|jgi:hypothetical protein|nr:HEAT repeat domain-containing protein [Planctomycetota bacterium]
MRNSHFIPICLLLLPITLNAQEGVKGPPFYDSTRSLTKQTNAAKSAKAIVKKGIIAVPATLKFLADRSVHVRDDVFHEIGRSFRDDAYSSLADMGLFSRDKRVAISVAEAIGRAKVVAQRPKLEKALSAKNSEVRAEVAWALGELGNSASVPALLKALQKEKRDYFARGEILLAVSRIDPQGTLSRLEEATTKSERLPGVRIVALSRLVEVDEGKAMSAALAVLSESRKSGPWSQRMLFQALETVRAVKKRTEVTNSLRKIIDILVGVDGKRGRMERERGRARHEIGNCLRELTGFKYPDDPKQWQTYWKQKRDSYIPKDKVSEQKTKKSKKEKLQAAAGDGDSVVTYMGIPVHSDRIGFLLDLSGGMRRPLGTKTRLTHAKDELISTLTLLSKDVHGNISFFATKYFSFARGKLIPLQRNFKPINAFIDKQQIPTAPNMGRGNLYDPLLELINAPSIDTIFLISEGNPTEGLYVSRERFLHHLMRRNRYLKVQIYSLLIGSSGQKYMESIAQGTGGAFHDVSGKN